MKFLSRSLFFVCIMLIMVFFKEDTLSVYYLPIDANSVYAAQIFHDGFNDIIVGHNTLGGWTNPTLTLMKNVFVKKTYFRNNKHLRSDK